MLKTCNQGAARSDQPCLRAATRVAHATCKVGRARRGPQTPTSCVQATMAQQARKVNAKDAHQALQAKDLETYLDVRWG